MARISFYTYIHHLFVFAASIISGTAIRNVNKCGDLRIKQPTILDRNVTFTFTPSMYQNATMIWQRASKWNPWSTLPQKYKFTQFEKDGTFYLIVTDTESKNDEVFYRIQYYNDTLNCTMKTPKLLLKDISEESCGFVYLRTEKIEYGENVDIEYFPTKTVIDNQEKYVHIWVRSGTDRITDFPTNGNGVYEENAMTNHKYVFTIFSYNARMDGTYGVRCGVEGEYSNMVEVRLPVAPNKPVFDELTDIEKCKNCIVCEDGVKCQVVCKTSGGTEPITVTMAIGTASPIAARYSDVDGGYVASFTLRNRHHMKLMRCSVVNDALTSPLIVSTHVYVTKPPTYQGIQIPKLLREGDPVNITCKFAAGRPAPTLSFKYKNTELSPVQQTHSSNITDSSYTSGISLTTFKKIWNGQNISCCRYSKWYKKETQCFPPKRVNYLFPPSDLKLQIKRKEDSPNEIYAVCTIYNSNPICKAKWQAPSGSIHSEINSRHTSKPYGSFDSEYTVTVNTNTYNVGEKINCTSDCSEFTLFKGKSVFLPYAPIIQFNISESVLNVSKGEQAYIKCTARSSPLANISWTENTTDNEELRELKQCQVETDCVITIRGDNITQRNLSCNTQHLLGSDTRKLTINIIEKNTDGSANKEDKAGAGADMSIYVALIGAGVGIVAIMVTVGLIVKRRRNDTKAKLENKALYSAGKGATRYNNEAEEPVNGNIDDVGQANAHSATDHPTPDEDATYSSVNKSGKSNASEASTSQSKQHVGAGQLLYADLDFDPTGSKPLTNTVVKRRDSPTEYVGIDFVKTAAGQKGGNESNEVDNIYANQ